MNEQLEKLLIAQVEINKIVSECLYRTPSDAIQAVIKDKLDPLTVAFEDIVEEMRK